MNVNMPHLFSRPTFGPCPPFFVIFRSPSGLPHRVGSSGHRVTGRWAISGPQQSNLANGFILLPRLADSRGGGVRAAGVNVKVPHLFSRPTFGPCPFFVIFRSQSGVPHWVGSSGHRVTGRWAISDPQPSNSANGFILLPCLVDSRGGGVWAAGVSF